MPAAGRGVKAGRGTLLAVRHGRYAAAMKTNGISPKVIANLIVAVVTFAFTNGLVGFDAATSALVAQALGTAAAVIAGPGDVTPRELRVMEPA